MTINDGLSYMKLLKQRHKELTDLRDINKSERVYLRDNKDYVEKPTYDVKAIDKMAMKVAKEIRKLDSAIKTANAIKIIDYDADDSVFEGLE